MKSNEVRSGQVRSVQVRSGQVKSGQIRSGQIKSVQVRSGQTGSPVFSGFWGAQRGENFVFATLARAARRKILLLQP